jgi:hypothetical protein
MKLPTMLFLFYLFVSCMLIFLPQKFKDIQMFHAHALKAMKNNDNRKLWLSSRGS